MQSPIFAFEFPTNFPSVDESEYLATCFGHVCDCIKGETSSLISRCSENRHLKRAQLLFVDNFTMMTSTLEQFMHKNNDAKHEN